MSRLSARLLASFLAVACWLASSPVVAEEDGPWTLGGGLHLAPLESYPHFGIGVEGSHALGRRARLGAELVAYLPHSYGDVTRSAFAANAIAHYALVSGARLRWYLLGGVGAGLLRDAYAARSVYPDVTAIAPGVLVGTGLELRFVQHFSLFLEPRAISYRSEKAADDEWLEAKLGLRWHGP
jgi:hypothetical protein